MLDHLMLDRQTARQREPRARYDLQNGGLARLWPAQLSFPLRVLCMAKCGQGRGQLKGRFRRTLGLPRVAVLTAIYLELRDHLNATAIPHVHTIDQDIATEDIYVFSQPHFQQNQPCGLDAAEEYEQGEALLQGPSSSQPAAAPKRSRSSF